MLKTRVITGAILCAAVGAVLLLSHVPWLFCTVIAGFCLQAVFELYRATGAKRKKGLYLLTCAAAAALAYLPIPRFDRVVGVLLPAAVLLFLYLMANVKRMSAISPALSAGIAGMLVCFYRTMADIRGEAQGFYTLTLALLVCSATDIAAYFVGRACGKHKLAPVVSPHKTVEGSIGGVVCSAALLLLLAFGLDRAGLVAVHGGRLTVYLLLASGMGQFGDLALSAVKRICGIKDYGTLLPGHGGVLDRFDSLALVLPFTLLFCRIAGPIFL